MDTAQSYNNLASNLHDQGRPEEAQPLYEKALEIRRHMLAADHPDIANSYNNLASNLNAQGKHDAAQPLVEKALSIFRLRLTDDHPDTLNSYNNVASNLDVQGKYDRAQPLYEKALEISLRLLTDDHPDTIRILGNLAAKPSRPRASTPRPSTDIGARSGARTRPGSGSRSPAWNAPGTRCRCDPASPPCWPGSVGRPRPGRRSRRISCRGLLDELSARGDQRLGPSERDRLRELTAQLEQLDKLVDTNPKDLDQAERARQIPRPEGVGA